MYINVSHKMLKDDFFKTNTNLNMIIIRLLINK